MATVWKPIGLAMCEKPNRRAGMTLMELLCVLVIISILAAIYLGAIGKAYVVIKKLLGGQ